MRWRERRMKCRYRGGGDGDRGERAKGIGSEEGKSDIKFNRQTGHVTCGHMIT